MSGSDGHSSDGDAGGNLDPMVATLVQETARAPWRELQRFFANGSALLVAAELDLVQVAAAVARDDQEQVKTWMDAGQFGQVPDSQALAWYDADASVWTVVVRPWVLVQAER